MTLQYSTMLKDAISNVLETMFFLVPEFAQGEQQAGFTQEPFLLDSSITINNETDRFKLLFRATRAFAGTLVANFLGVEQGRVTLEEMEDTLKELANMVGGDCLARLPANGWRLGIPKIEPSAQNADDGSTLDRCSLKLFVEEELMALVRIQIEPLGVPGK